MDVEGILEEEKVGDINMNDIKYIFDSVIPYIKAWKTTDPKVMTDLVGGTELLWKSYLDMNRSNPIYVFKQSKFFVNEKTNSTYVCQFQESENKWMIEINGRLIGTVDEFMRYLGVDILGLDIDQLYNFINKKNKTLKESIENNRSNKLMKIVYKKGVFEATRLVGDYQNLLKMISPNEIPIEMKGEAIVDYLGRVSDGYGVGFGEIGIDPILWKETRDEIHQIEYLGRSGVIVQVWGGYNWDTDIGEYGIPYEALPHKILDEILMTITS